MAEDAVTLLRVPAPEAGDRFQVTPLFAGSPLALPVSAAVPPASTCGLEEETETVTFGGGGGGGGGVLLLLHPAVTTSRNMYESNTAKLNLLFTGSS